MTSPRDARVASEQVELLRQLLDRQISSLVHYAWDPPEPSASAPDPGWTAFRGAPGPLVVGLDNGAELAFASSPAQASVLVWLERDTAGGRPPGGAVADKKKLFAIRAEDEKHGDDVLTRLIGSRIVGVEIWQRQATSAKLRALPRDAGVVLIMEHGQRLVVGHGLHDGSDDLAVLEPAQIDPEIRLQLVCLQTLGQSPL